MLTIMEVFRDKDIGKLAHFDTMTVEIGMIHMTNNSWMEVVCIVIRSQSKIRRT